MLLVLPIILWLLHKFINNCYTGGRKIILSKIIQELEIFPVASLNLPPGSFSAMTFSISSCPLGFEAGKSTGSLSMKWGIHFPTSFLYSHPKG